jgi:hypothetical protein
MDWAGIASKMVPVIDETSAVRPKDLDQPSGVPIRARVRAGVVDDVGFMTVGKLNDWRVVSETIARIEARVAKALLIGAESVRPSERTTAFEVNATVVRALDGALGGLYTPIADLKQRPIIERAVWQAERDRLLKPLPRKHYETQILTGATALSRGSKVQGLLSIVEVARNLGPEAVAKIDTRALVDVLARYQNIYEPAVIKSDEQLAREQREAERAQTRALATEQAISSAGAIAEQRAAQPLIPQQ